KTPVTDQSLELTDHLVSGKMFLFFGTTWKQYSGTVAVYLGQVCFTLHQLRSVRLLLSVYMAAELKVLIFCTCCVVALNGGMRFHLTRSSSLIIYTIYINCAGHIKTSFINQGCGIVIQFVNYISIVTES
ncbi:hypothetical protein XENOCAPTIV_015316, partial [Xenoophorus captivus]